MKRRPCWRSGGRRKPPLPAKGCGGLPEGFVREAGGLWPCKFSRGHRQIRLRFAPCGQALNRLSKARRQAHVERAARLVVGGRACAVDGARAVHADGVAHAVEALVKQVVDAEREGNIGREGVLPAHIDQAVGLEAAGFFAGERQALVVVFVGLLAAIEGDGGKHIQRGQGLVV